jgi:hypothetical protein
MLDIPNGQPYNKSMTTTTTNPTAALSALLARAGDLAGALPEVCRFMARGGDARDALPLVEATYVALGGLHVELRDIFDDRDGELVAQVSDTISLFQARALQLRGRLQAAA